MARVMIAEADGTIRDVVREILGEYGHEVMAVGNGEAAMAILRTSRQPLVVLIDEHLPGGEGVLAAAATATPPGRHHAAALLTTTPHSKLPPAMVATVEDLGIPVLTKPFHVADLEALVSRLAGLIEDRIGMAG